MTRIDFGNEWRRLTEGFNEPEVPAARLDALYARFGQRGLPLLREMVSALLLGNRYPTAEQCSKAYGEACQRQQEHESARFKADSPTFSDLNRCRSEYSAFRANLIIRMLGEHLSPKQVADILEAARPQFPEIDIAEIMTYRRRSSWACAALDIIGEPTPGARASYHEDPTGMIWLAPGKWGRRDSPEAQAYIRSLEDGSWFNSPSLSKLRDLPSQPKMAPADETWHGWEKAGYRR